jgi:hypothetical protein
MSNELHFISTTQRDLSDYEGNSPLADILMVTGEVIVQCWKPID